MDGKLTQEKVENASETCMILQACTKRCCTVHSFLVRTFRWVSVVFRGVLVGRTSILEHTPILVSLSARGDALPAPSILPVDAGPVPSPTYRSSERS